MTCSVCGAEGYARELCQKHYRRWRRHGDPSVVVKPHRSGPNCSECGKPHHARGLCTTHYRQWLRTTPDRASCTRCDTPAEALGLCNAHYLARQRVNRPRRARPQPRPCTNCAQAPGRIGSGLCTRCYNAWYHQNVRKANRPQPAPAPTPRVEVGEWIDRGDGVTVVHWPKGVACPVCDADSARAA